MRGRAQCSMLPPPVTLSQALPGAPTLDRILIGMTTDGPLTVVIGSLVGALIVLLLTSGLRRA